MVNLTITVLFLYHFKYFTISSGGPFWFFGGGGACAPHAPPLLTGLQEIVNSIKVLYADTKVRVLTSDGDPDTFDYASGTLQSDTLAPFLFIIVLDNVLRISLDVCHEKGLQIYL